MGYPTVASGGLLAFVPLTRCLREGERLMRSYDPAVWQPFFTAIIAAAAALTGLLFVAVSINLDKIVSGHKFLPARAAETLAILLLVMIISALVLIPQSTRLMGAEILVLALLMLPATLVSQLNYRRKMPDDPVTWLISRMTATALALIPCLVAGISLAAHGGGGFYWLAATTLLGIVAAVYSAWVLLVEIVR